MDEPTDSLTCKACAHNRELIARLDERLTALEVEIRGAPVEIMLEEFQAAKARRDARQTAVDEFHRRRQEEFYKRLPELKKAADEHKVAYEQIHARSRFEP